MPASIDAPNHVVRSPCRGGATFTSGIEIIPLSFLSVRFSSFSIRVGSPAIADVPPDSTTRPSSSPRSFRRSSGVSPPSAATTSSIAASTSSGSPPAGAPCITSVGSKRISAATNL